MKSGFINLYMSYVSYIIFSLVFFDVNIDLVLLWYGHLIWCFASSFLWTKRQITNRIVYILYDFIQNLYNCLELSYVHKNVTQYQNLLNLCYEDFMCPLKELKYLNIFLFVFWSSAIIWHVYLFIMLIEVLIVLWKDFVIILQWHIPPKK